MVVQQELDELGVAVETGKAQGCLSENVTYRLKQANKQTHPTSNSCQVKIGTCLHKGVCYLRGIVDSSVVQRSLCKNQPTDHPAVLALTQNRSSCASTGAPAAINFSDIAAWPLMTAQCRGVYQVLAHERTHERTPYLLAIPIPYRR